MPEATLTSKGQLTVPKAVRDLLRLETGDTVEFIIGPGGEVHVRAGRVDVEQLCGMLHASGRKPVSLAGMDDAIRTARRRPSPKAPARPRRSALRA